MEILKAKQCTEHAHQERIPAKVVFLDVDSTLVDIEGIDELARMKGVVNQVKQLTTAAMNGLLKFEEVYETRLGIIKPTWEDLIEIGHLYIDHITPGVYEFVRKKQEEGAELFAVSGGFNPSIKFLALALGIPQRNVYANELCPDQDGRYTIVNKNVPFPLWTHSGKQDVIRHVKQYFIGRSGMIGDSMGDLDAGKLTDVNIHFSGVVKRPNVQAQAGIIIENMDLSEALLYL